MESGSPGPTWESVRIEPHELVAIGDHVVGPMSMHVKGRDGIELPARVAWLATIGDGAMTRFAMYHELEDAREAAGGPAHDPEVIYGYGAPSTS